MKALVTGASGGIGSEIVSSLLDEGHEVIGTYLSHSNSSIIVRNPSLEWTQIDLCSDDYLERLDSYLKNVNIFIHAAGVAHTSRINDYKEFMDIRNLMQINLLSAIEITSRIIDNVINTGYGRIIYFSSITSDYGAPGLSAYTSSKAGLEGFVKSLNRELVLLKRENPNLNSSANVIRPGYVNTQLTSEVPLAIKGKITRNSTYGKFLAKSDIAEVVKFLINENSNYISGSCIDVNGGQSI